MGQAPVTTSDGPPVRLQLEQAHGSPLDGSSSVAPELEQPGIETLNKAELIALADERGIRVATRWSKARIITAIEEAS